MIKGISSFDASKGARLATYAARCVENEILMHFRRLKRGCGEVSLSDYIETGKDGGALSLMDVVCSEEDLFEDFSNRELYEGLYTAVSSILDERERKIINARYGLEGNPPLTQRETASLLGISRSYVSRIEKKALQKLKEYLEKDDACIDRAELL